MTDDDAELVDPKIFYDLSDHPVHQKCLAEMAAIHSAIEYQLCHVLAWLLHCFPPHAAAAYFQLVNYKARLDMIRGLSHWAHDEEERTKVAAIIDTATEAAKVRNKYVHGLWRRKGNAAYLALNLDRHYPHGTMQKVSETIIVTEARKVRTSLAMISALMEELTLKRPLRVDPQAIKPSYLSKFRRQSKRPN
jgi:hypothetical protein